MPHSSGGGSHGGSHRGSSSHSRHGGSGSSSYVGRSHRPGAMRFRRRRSTGGYDYIFADHDVTQKPGPARYFMLLFYLPFIIAILFMFSEMVSIPKKIHANYNKEIVVKDNLRVIKDKDSLYDVLSEFQNITGITPCVVTVDMKEWSDYYYLEDYAYDYYVDTWPDEFHWLFVYSTDGSEWYWEGMQGDDTDSILSIKKTSQFTKDMQIRLERGLDIGTALEESFENLNKVAMKISLSFEQLVPFLIMGGFVAFHCYFMVFYDPSKKYREYELDSSFDPITGMVNKAAAAAEREKLTIAQEKAGNFQHGAGEIVKCSFCGADIFPGESKCSFCGQSREEE